MYVMPRRTPLARPEGLVAPSRGAAAALTMMRRFRRVMWIVCAALAVAGWLADNDVLIGLALVIAAEETLEATVVIGALRLAR
jgi:hypothetical protein